MKAGRAKTPGLGLPQQAVIACRVLRSREVGDKENVVFKPPHRARIANRRNGEAPDPGSHGPVWFGLAALSLVPVPVGLGVLTARPKTVGR